jgi:crotonobetainyl-CoA:carnitine CoA-transferase CaiB-like acyl-CoA transferase
VSEGTDPKGPLNGVRVIDAATIYAGPLIATLLGDYGADVVKIEHPRGDGLRNWGWEKGGESLWWSFVSRNKRSVSLSLSDPRGAAILREMVQHVDVLIENFRPGTFEKWGLDPQDLLTLNPKLVVVRVSGFGQTGPYHERPGFGTLAEAISGFAATNGAAEGPPVLPQWPLADGVAGVTGAFATMVALRHAEATGAGQIVDLSIYEPLFWILGAQTTAYDQLGVVPQRRGSSTSVTVPRECFRTCDGRWVALSGATLATAIRIMSAVGRDDIAQQPWFSTMEGRLEHRHEIDEAIAEWVGHRSEALVLQEMQAVGATVGPVYTIADIAADPHFVERTITSVEHPRLGPIKMQGLIARLTGTPGSIRETGAMIGQHSEAVLTDMLDYTATQIDELRAAGVIHDSPNARD